MLAGAGNLCLLIGNWTSVDRRILLGLHLTADASHKNVELDCSGITGIGVFASGTLLLARSSVKDQCPRGGHISRSYKSYKAH